MKPNPMKQAEEAQHEARLQAAMQEFNRSPEAKGVRVIPEDQGPLVKVANEVFAQATRRKEQAAASEAEPAETDQWHYPKLSRAEREAAIAGFEKAQQAEREFKQTKRTTWLRRTLPSLGVSTARTDEEIRRMLWLRAVEWSNWPAFVSGAVAPILLLWIPWWKVLLGVVAINTLWAAVRHRIHSLKIANLVAILVTPGQWVVTLICMLAQAVHRHWALAALSLCWPFLCGLISFPGGNLVLIQHSFASELGLTRGEEPT
jgi:hypothetical protein